MRRVTPWTLAALALTAGLVVACSDDGYDDFNPDSDARPDGGLQDANPMADVPPLVDRIINPAGPDITITLPQADAVLSGNQAQVVATVTDEDGVDVSSVRAVIPGGAAFTLSRSGTVDHQYSGLIDISEMPTTDNLVIIVEAADLLGIWNSEVVEVRRDRGPVVSITSPVDGERYAGSVNLSFQVADPNGVEETSVQAEVGGLPLDVENQSQDESHGASPQWINFTGEIVFDDPMFDPPLQSIQQIIITAQNIANGVSSVATLTFQVDDEGPVITVLTPTPGEIVGGVITIEAEVADEAGVLNTSVVAVLGGNALAYTIPLTPTGSSFIGIFDTSQFPSNYVFPPLSVRAADMLNNESEVGFVLALDNAPPVVSLDPPANMRVGENDNGDITCSRGFDPVGAFSPNDASTVPQVHFVRARIEDRGNEAVGLLQEQLSLVNYLTPRVYWLADTTQALVVDTNGDGICDEINPELIPTTNPQGGNEVLALYLDPIPPTGGADFRGSSGLPPVCDQPGTDLVAPDALCAAATPEGMSIAIHYTVDVSEPAIWSLPQVDPSSELFCSGHQFDNFASNLPEGWICVAARAEDNAGNTGVSEPIRVCVDYTLDGNPSTCGVPADMPNCTGTLDPQTQTVDPTVPCQFTASQRFPENEVRIDL